MATHYCDHDGSTSQLAVIAVVAGRTRGGGGEPMKSRVRTSDSSFFFRKQNIRRWDGTLLGIRNLGRRLWQSLGGDTVAAPYAGGRFYGCKAWRVCGVVSVGVGDILWMNYIRIVGSSSSIFCTLRCMLRQLLIMKADVRTWSLGSRALSTRTADSPRNRYCPL